MRYSSSRSKVVANRLGIHAVFLGGKRKEKEGKSWLASFWLIGEEENTIEISVGEKVYENTCNVV